MIGLALATVLCCADGTRAVPAEEARLLHEVIEGTKETRSFFSAAEVEFTRRFDPGFSHPDVKAEGPIWYRFSYDGEQMRIEERNGSAQGPLRQLYTWDGREGRRLNDDLTEASLWDNNEWGESSQDPRWLVSWCAPYAPWLGGPWDEILGQVNVKQVSKETGEQGELVVVVFAPLPEVTY